MVSLSTLNNTFKNKVVDVLKECEEVHGIHMKPFFTIRTPVEQAKLYRQSRLTKDILEKANWLHNKGAPWLAKVLIDVGPQQGKLGAHVTNAIPGLSWHQFGDAVDCFWDKVPAEYNWSTTKLIDGKNGYKIYADVAQKHGLFSGGLNWGWDWPHVQANSHNSPLGVYSYAMIDKIMKEKYDV